MYSDCERYSSCCPDNCPSSITIVVVVKIEREEEKSLDIGQDTSRGEVWKKGGRC
jgi:hypothetical protein